MFLLTQPRLNLREFYSASLYSRNLSWGWTDNNIFYRELAAPLQQLFFIFSLIGIQEVIQMKIAPTHKKIEDMIAKKVYFNQNSYCALPKLADLQKTFCSINLGMKGMQGSGKQFLVF